MRKLPHLGTPGKGLDRQLPSSLGDAGRACKKSRDLTSERLRAVRDGPGLYAGAGRTHSQGEGMLRGLVKAVRPFGDHQRHGITGVFLDPPYADEARPYPDNLYASDSGSWRTP